MLDYNNFEKYMMKIKEQEKKELNLDSALKELSPDFGGFFSETIPTIVDLLSIIMNDEEGWISYYIWESNWGEEFPEVWDKDGNTIPLKTIEDLYNIIIDSNKE